MTVRAGQTWRDKRVDKQPGYRRLVAVTAVDESYVHGVGRYQVQRGDAWIGVDWPGHKRKTRVLLSQFVKNYEHVEGEEFL